MGVNSKVTASIFDPTVAWSTWAPTWTNLTVGNGTALARYMRIGKLIAYRLRFTLGSSSAVGTNPSFTVPVTPLASYVSDDMFGYGDALNAGVSATSVQVRYNGGGVARFSPVTATSPFTFGVGDVLTANGFYEAA